MASQAGRRGEALVAVYCATKAAVISLTQSAGLDLIKHRHQRQCHRARAWSTASTGMTSMRCLPNTRTASRARRSDWSARPCLTAAWERPTDLAGMAVFLASADSDYVVAQTYNVDGGNWMS